MMGNVVKTKRIVKNTLVLYVRMFLLILAQLYIVPVLLQSLGVVDYGIYNVVAGIVLMLHFVSGSLASGAQRFLAYAIGQGNYDNLREVLSSTFVIYSRIAICLAFLLEIIGVWFLNTQMDMPVERLAAANWVFQFTVIFFIIEIITTPFRAAIIAHEQMSIYAYVSIADSLLKLLAAILIGYIPYDKLITYSILYSFVALTDIAAYWGYCRWKFPECRKIVFKWNPEISGSLLTYSGWNIIGAIALMLRNQGINIVQNIFFGPVVNAAHAISQQVNGAVNNFVHNIYVASRPQITKLYAANQRTEMWSLVFQSAKLAFFLMMYICIPAILEMDAILSLWLNEVPPFTSYITRLMIVVLLAETLVNQLIAVFQAANRIKKYQLYASTILLLNIPISFALYHIDCESPYVPYLVSLCLSLIYILAIVWIAYREVGLDVLSFFKNVFLKNVIVFLFSIILSWLAQSFFEPSVYRLLFTIFVSLFISSFFIWSLGLNTNERNYIIKYVKSKIENENS